MTEEEIYKTTVDLWGVMFQKLMVIEECAELISALCKQFRGRVTNSNVTEEAVDVQIMLKQLRVILNDNDNWDEQMKFKLDKLETRIKGGGINANR